MLMNPFSHGQNMAQSSTSSTMDRGSQGPPMSTGNNPVANVYMMNVEAHIVTSARYYKMLESIEKGKESTNPLIPLQIEKTTRETMACILKGAFKKDSHKKNMRVS
jgi:hypothetical protein